MTFVSAGLAIAGLAAIAIPIIIHLLSRQRRRPIEWAAMRFLIEAFKKQRRRLRLEQLLLLLVRCAIPAVLGLALARPFLESGGLLDAGGNRSVYIVIDNGLATMAQNSEGESALAAHVDQAVEMIDALGPGDSVGVVTTATPARAVIHPPTTDHAAIIDLLRGLKPSEARTDLAGTMQQLRSVLGADEPTNEGSQRYVYLLSDFRSGSAPLDVALPAALADVGSNVTLLATNASDQTIDNVQIVSIDPVRRLVLTSDKVGSGQVTVRLARFGRELGKDVTRVRLVGDSLQPLEPKLVEWQAGQSESEVDFNGSFTVQDERRVGITAVIDDDNLHADNQRHVVMDLRNRVRVLLVDRRGFGMEQSVDQLSAGQWIRRALEPVDDGSIEVVQVEPAALEIADVRLADVVVIPRPDLLRDVSWSILRGFVDGGGMLIVTPPSEVNVHQWVEHLTDDLSLPWQFAMEPLETEDGFTLADEQPTTEFTRMLSGEFIDLVQPVVVYRYLPVSSTASHARAVLALQNGDPLLITGSPVLPEGETEEGGQDESRGLVAMFTTAPELSWTNLPSKPLMVPLFHELLRQGLGRVRSQEQFTVGEQPLLSLSRVGSQLRGPESLTISLDDRDRPVEALPSAGLYEVLDPGSQPVGLIAVNVDAAGAGTVAQPTDSVVAWLSRSGPWGQLHSQDIAATLRTTQSGSPLARILLITLIVLIVLETVLARWFSHAARYAQRPGRRGLLPSIRQPSAQGGSA